MKDGIDWCLSVFVDNSGVVAFDDEHAVCFKCETHNRPSAIEPYGGAATGIGGAGTFIVGVVLFGDALSLMRILGVVLIVIGVATLKFSS
jgi:hypothetical protein